MLRQALEANEKNVLMATTTGVGVAENINNNNNETASTAVQQQQPQASQQQQQPPIIDTSYNSSNNQHQQSAITAEGYNSGDDQYDDDEYSASTDDDDDDDVIEFNDNIPPSSFVQRIFYGIKTCIRIVANVENLWDETPPTSPDVTSHNRHRRRNKTLVLFWFVVLATSYCGERATFKLLVDNAGPFRLVSVQMVTFCHAIMVGIGLLITQYIKLRQSQHRNSNSNNVFSTDQNLKMMPLGIPIVDVSLMAVLDTVTLLVMFISGVHVPPTLTVILVQFTIPLTAFLTQFMHPNGRWSCCRSNNDRHDGIDNNDNDDDTTNNTDNINGNNSDERTPLTRHTARPESYNINNGSNNGTDQQQQQQSSSERRRQQNSNNNNNNNWGGLEMNHVWGSIILFIAVIIALLPALYSIINPEFFYYADSIPIRTAINTLFYVSSCIPAAASQLYKEHIFIQYKQPVNMEYMNLLLSIFQFIFASIIAPLAYGLQGLGGRGVNWIKLYPSGDFGDNIRDGLQCFANILDHDDQLNKYPEDADCTYTLLLVLIHVFSIIAVGIAVDKIVKAGATNVMYRGISAGIILAALSMHFYDLKLPDFNYGPAIDALNLLSIIILILGTELYHRTSLSESTFETVYPDVEVPTFDDY